MPGSCLQAHQWVSCGAGRDVDERRVGGAPDVRDCGGGVLLSETFALPRAN